MTALTILSRPQPRNNRADFDTTIGVTLGTRGLGTVYAEGGNVALTTAQTGSFSLNPAQARALAAALTAVSLHIDEEEVA